MPRASTDAQVLKALGHPIRRQVMALLADGVASPKEMAATLGVALPNVSYHVGILRDLGLIKVVRETQRRGAVEHHYRAISRSLSSREVIEWILAADETRPKGWQAQVIEMDQAGAEDLDAAIQKMWTEVDKAQSRSERRVARGQTAAARFGVAVVKTQARESGD